MAGKNDPYETETVRHGYSDKKVRKMVEEGWEVVKTTGGQLGSATSVTLRRPNPKYRGGGMAAPQPTAPVAWPPPVAPANWYRDPAGGPGLRYWDGTRWTDQTHSQG